LTSKSNSRINEKHSDFIESDPNELNLN